MEIEFKGWSPKYQKWIYGSHVLIGDNNYIINKTLRANDTTFVGKDSVKQYIGIVDRNGDKIYANDYVKVFFDYGRKLEYQAEIIWDSTRCGYVLDFHNDMGICDFSKAYMIELELVNTKREY